MLLTPFALLAALIPLADAHGHNAGPAHLRHRHLAVRSTSETANIARSNEAHAAAHRAIKRTVNKRGQQCRPRGQSKPSAASLDVTVASSTVNTQAATSSTAAYSESPSQAPSQAPSSAWQPDPSPSPSVAAPPTPSPQPSADTSGNAGDSAHWGVLAVTDGTCGWSNANDQNPNGSQDWLNCGINGAGWTPPHVSIDQLIAAELDASGVFSPCDPYIEKFKQYGAEFNVYPIMLASFAMQESTCNPSVTGGGGEAGLMQIAPPNCEPGVNCWDVDYNIRRGAQLFRQMIDANGGNVLAAIGAYNGWRKGMTVSDAMAAKWQGHCRNQNNLDYIFQYCNGWMQNKNAYHMGSYFNLADC